MRSVIRADIALAAFAGMAVLAIQALVLAADQWWGVDHYHLVRDPNAIAGNPNYFGLVSNLGIVLWISGAAGALQARAALGRRPAGHVGGVLLTGGLFAALMGLDDFFMLHESVAGAGVPEPAVLLPHALLLALLCYHAWFVRARTPWRTLAMSVTSFGLSLAVDVYPVHFPAQVFIEESFKLLGIAMLAVYLLAVGQSALKARLAADRIEAGAGVAANLRGVGRAGGAPLTEPVAGQAAGEGSAAAASLRSA
ncbi:hypothetical protein [Shinella sp. BYT-45]|uniref:hypothetical protein n=1 Tax=Shinella sp. BYT-45 TaxID=3377377 RepID=UPI00397F5408